MTKQRFFIATSGNDHEAYKEAMQYACTLTDNDPEIKKVILLIHTKQNTGWLERISPRHRNMDGRKKQPIKGVWHNGG